MSNLVSNAIVTAFNIAASKNKTQFHVALGASLRAIRAIRLAEREEAVAYNFYVANANGLKAQAEDVDWAEPEVSEAVKRCKKKLKPVNLNITIPNKQDGFTLEQVIENSYDFLEGGACQVSLDGLAVSDKEISPDMLKRMGYNTFNLVLSDAMAFYVVYHKMLDQKVGQSGDYGYRLFKTEKSGMPLAVSYFSPVVASNKEEVEA
tara:strand:- start:423 stop:1040 length:618 start_codon:yes stop_codon:yes gene_type:complete